MQNLEDFKQELAVPRKVVIIPHRRPDADALGSCLALANYLQKTGHFPQVISPDEYPGFLSWMHGNEQVLIYEKADHRPEADKAFKEAELIFCLDFSSLDRIEQMSVPVREASAKKILIDHHLGKKDFADFEMWDTSAAATAELVYELIVMMGHKHLIGLPIAECIYAGIMTDTGSFKHPSTTSKVHRIVADLMDMGLKSDRIHRLIFDTNTESRIKLIGYALDKKLVINRKFSTAYISLSGKELSQFDSRTGDTEGLVNYALSIEGIKLAVMFIERPESVSISFRSVGSLAVNELAEQHFEGGGHKNAAGGKMAKPLDDVLAYFNNILPYYENAIAQAED